ncbi:hypothetical protein P9112_014716 [Eukaryota sp. TZLM1-RC]
MDPVSQFLSIFPDASPETAKQFLDIANGDIEQAIVFYTDSAPPEAFPTSSQPPSRPPQPSPPSRSPQAAPPQRRVATLSDFSGCGPQSCESCPSSCKDEREVEYFAGHGEGGSGESLLPPRSHKDKVDNIIAQAKQGGPPPEPTEPAPSFFQGAGYRLGETNFMRREEFQQPPATLNEGPITVNVTIYSNGLLVDDETFFSFNDPSNEGMLDAMMRQEIPPQLQDLIKQKNRGGPFRAREISVQLSDKKSEEYQPPKPKFEAFKGHGMRLGATPSRPSPQVSQASVQKAPSKPAVPAPSNGDRCRVKVRLARGGVEVFEVSKEGKVADLWKLVASQTGSSRFELYPPVPGSKALDKNLSIRSAGLVNGVAIQK